jgi:hypothetical protein
MRKVYVARLASLTEPLKSLVEQSGIRVSPSLARQDNLLTMDALKRMAKRWPVVFLQEILTNLDDVVGPDAEDVGVERAVVDSAHRDAIGDYRLASVAVFLDMSCIEKLWVSQPAQRARPTVGAQDSNAECG